MLRAACSILPLVLSFACNQPSAKPGPPSAASVAPQATTAAPAPPASASATPSATSAGACAPLAWDKDGMNAKAASFTGKISNGEGSNARGDMEKFQTLVLQKPACGPDSAPITEIQLYTNDKSIDLKKLVGKSVTIDGEPFSAHTAHHHRPIVVEVKKLTAN